ncbi:MAG: ras GTPase protein [uncultured bacterium]|nr:MAG: ras GTPase protein [uncultured bacterium]
MKKVDAINSSYDIFVDGQSVAQGKFTDYRQTNAVNIPIDKLQAKGSKISIRKQGDSDVYLTVAVKEFRTDKKTEAVDKGLSIVRTYQPEKEAVGAPLAVGDMVNVTLSVTGKFDEKYVLIEDHLPSGLIPINPKFNNEQASGGGESAQLTNGKSYNYAENREVTKDGMIISIEDLKEGTNVFTYRARVVSQGTFNVIPAVVTKMYSPEVYGRTSAQKIVVQKERINNTVFENVVEKKNMILFIIAGLTIVLILTISGYYLWRRRNTTLE